VAASFADPYLIIRREDGTISLFVGDSVARTVSDAVVPDDVSFPLCEAVEVFTDVTGVYRTFEATKDGQDEHASLSKHMQISAKQRTRTQLTGEQLKRLQDAKPAIALDTATTESAFNASRGTQWLATLGVNGELQVSLNPPVLANIRSARCPTCSSCSSHEVCTTPRRRSPTT
jgi:cleavage and polyadenylation specificity factor subunit 1